MFVVAFCVVTGEGGAVPRRSVGIIRGWRGCWLVWREMFFDLVGLMAGGVLTLWAGEVIIKLVDFGGWRLRDGERRDGAAGRGYGGGSG